MNILICTNEEFAPAATTTLKSFSVFNSGIETQVFIFHDGITENTQQKIRQSLPTLKSITFKWVSAARFSKLGIPTINGSFSCYYKLLASELIDEKIEKIIYLDSDILVLDNLNKVWTWPIEPYLLLAVEDAQESIRGLSNTYLDSIAKEINTPLKKTYFNSGFLVLNLKKWRNNNFQNRIFNLALNFQKRIVWHDQDLLNLVVGLDWDEIPKRWNVQTPSFYKKEGCLFGSRYQFYKELLSNPAIVHFTGGAHKPWKTTCDHPYREVFLHFLRQTEFSDWPLLSKSTSQFSFNKFKKNTKTQILRRVWAPRKFKNHLQSKFMK